MITWVGISLVVCIVVLIFVLCLHTVELIEYIKLRKRRHENQASDGPRIVVLRYDDLHDRLRCELDLPWCWFVIMNGCIVDAGSAVCSSIAFECAERSLGEP